MIYFGISIDTECDRIGNTWQIKYPLQFASVEKGIALLLQPLFNNYSAAPTYLLSPEVIQDSQAVNALKKLKGKFELGTHLHSEFIEPQEEKNPMFLMTMQNQLPPETEREKLENLTRLFEHKFGSKPKSFRAGRYGLSKNTLRILCDLGYIVDTSVAPHCAWSDRGGTINHFGAPEFPYHPHESDFRKKGDLPIWEIPITISMTRWNILPAFLRRKVNPWSPIVGLFQRIWRDKLKPIWLRPVFSSAQKMEQLVKYLITKHDNKKPLVFNMMFHSMEVIAGASPRTKTDDDVRLFLRDIKYMLQFFEHIDAKSVTLSEMTNILNKKD